MSPIHKSEVLDVQYVDQNEDGSWPVEVPWRVRHLGWLMSLILRSTLIIYEWIYGYEMFQPLKHEFYARGFKDAMEEARASIGIPEGESLVPVFQGTAEELKEFIRQNPDLEGAINRGPAGKLGETKGERDA
jgi:hypothetical protein